QLRLLRPASGGRQGNVPSLRIRQNARRGKSGERKGRGPAAQFALQKPTEQCRALPASAAIAPKRDPEPDQRAPWQSRAGDSRYSDLDSGRREAESSADCRSAHRRTREDGPLERQTGDAEEQARRDSGGTGEDAFRGD